MPGVAGRLWVRSDPGRSRSARTAPAPGEAARPASRCDTACGTERRPWRPARARRLAHTRRGSWLCRSSGPNPSSTWRWGTMPNRLANAHSIDRTPVAGDQQFSDAPSAAGAESHGRCGALHPGGSRGRGSSRPVRGRGGPWRPGSRPSRRSHGGNRGPNWLASVVKRTCAPPISNDGKACSSSGGKAELAVMRRMEVGADRRRPEPQQRAVGCSSPGGATPRLPAPTGRFETLRYGKAGGKRRVRTNKPCLPLRWRPRDRCSELAVQPCHAASSSGHPVSTLRP